MASSTIKILVLFLFGCSSADIAHVTYDGLNFEIQDGVPEYGWVANGDFVDKTFEDGFAYLDIETNPEYDDEEQAYSAGYLEGMLTHEMIYNHYRNTMEGYCDDKSEGYCENLRKYLLENMEWMDQAIAEGKSDPILYNAGLILKQLEGIEDGYNSTAVHPIEDGGILMMNMLYELGDLEDALDPDIRNMTLEEWIELESWSVLKDGHCSALIKVLPGNEDLYVGHNTWTSFTTFLRILKKYKMPFLRTNTSEPDDVVPGHTVSFPSYPGVLYSANDFYIMSSGLVSMETTIGNYNPELWKYVQPKRQLHEWMRNIIANRLATDGQSWTRIFSQYNSGTYNNEWMVIDYNLFEPGSTIKPNTLWVLDQIPGYVESGDQSDRLMEDTYFPSYNIASYKIIFNLSGSEALADKYGKYFDYKKAPRALMFDRDHNKVIDMDSMFNIMRYNDFKNDPLAKCDCDPPYSGLNAIAARCDLNPINGTYEFIELSHSLDGATDAKVTNYKLVKSLQYWAINGPTNVQQPTFRWSDQEEADKVPHYGHPDAFNFPWVLSELEE